MKSRINETISCIALLLLAQLPAGCTDREEEADGGTTDRFPTTALQITSVTAGKEARTVVTAPEKLDAIAVYAQNDHTNTYAAGNNHAVYTRSGNGSGGSTWSMGQSPRILLSGEIADVYAYHPSTIALSGGATGVDANTTIPITVFTGNASKETDNTLPLPQSGDAAGSIYTAPGETDYLWANPTKASNGKGTAPQGTTPAIALTMNHALAQVSFRIYKDATYTHTGMLTKIHINGIPIGTDPKMTVADGNIAAGNDQTGNYTRYLAGSGYTLTSLSGTPGSDALNALPAFGMLVLPHAVTDKSSIAAVFTVDGKDYTVSFSSTDKAWSAGNNCRYTIRLSGTEATVSAIYLEPWKDTNGENNNDIY